MADQSTIEGFVRDTEQLGDEIRRDIANIGNQAKNSIAAITTPPRDVDTPAFGDDGGFSEVGVQTDTFTVTDPFTREEQGGVRAIPEFLTPLQEEPFTESAPEHLETGTLSVDKAPDEDGALDLRSNNQTMPPDPSMEVDKFTEGAPTINTNFAAIQFPNVATDFAPLNLISVDVPTRSVTADLPGFVEDRPEFFGVTPGQNDYKNAIAADFDTGLTVAQASTDAWMNKHFPNYSSQVSALDTHLSNILSGTSTAWGTSVVNSIYDRRRTQTEAETARVNEQLERSTARRGLLTDLAMPLATARAEQAGHDANVVAAYEVAERTAERETAYLERARDLLNQNRLTAVTLEQTKQQINIAQAQFALSYAQLGMDGLIQAHNAAVTRYNADMQRYSTDAEVYEVKVRASFKELEALAKELEVARLQSTVNRDLIAELEAKIAAEQSKIQLFTSKIQARISDAEYRRLPLEEYRANIEGNLAYLEGRKVEVGIHDAIINSRRAITDDDLARAQVYKTRVDTWAKRSEAEQRVEGHKLSVNKDRRDEHRLLLDRYQTSLQRIQSINADERGFDANRLRRWGELIAKTLEDERRDLQRDVAVSDQRAQYDKMNLDWALGSLNSSDTRVRATSEVLAQWLNAIENLGSAIMAANGSTMSLINSTQE